LVVQQAGQEKFKAYIETFGTVLRDCQYTNPRKIKRILNRYLIFLSKFDQEQTLDQYVIENIVRLQIQAEYFPDLFQLYLTESDLPDSLRRIGTDKFDIKAFEAGSGVPIAQEYAQLSRMKGLFQLINPLPGSKQVGLRQHARAVFSIARLK
jgi:hypothetical protein